jgi:hypothetical protein
LVEFGPGRIVSDIGLGITVQRSSKQADATHPAYSEPSGYKACPIPFNRNAPNWPLLDK